MGQPRNCPQKQPNMTYLTLKGTYLVFLVLQLNPMGQPRNCPQKQPNMTGTYLVFLVTFVDYCSITPLD